MPVPDYQALMRPFLAAHEDGVDHPVSEVRAALADAFRLTEEERAEMLPSGGARTFNNRVGGPQRISTERAFSRVRSGRSTASPIVVSKF